MPSGHGTQIESLLPSTPFMLYLLELLAIVPRKLQSIPAHPPDLRFEQEYSLERAHQPVCHPVAAMCVYASLSRMLQNAEGLFWKLSVTIRD